MYGDLQCIEGSAFEEIGGVALPLIEDHAGMSGMSGSPRRLNKADALPPMTFCGVASLRIRGALASCDWEYHHARERRKTSLVLIKTTCVLRRAR
jgi:hypothetical protein